VKIAVWHNLPSGGGKRALYYHVRGLAQRGHELKCWSLDTADHSYLPLSEFATERIVPVDLNHRPKVFDRWTSSYKEAVNHMRSYDEACRRCAGEIEAEKFDLVFANNASYYTMPFVLRHLRTKKVLYLQEPSRYLYEARPQLPWVTNAPDHLDTRLFKLRTGLANYPNLQLLRLRAKQEWLNVRACDRLLVNSYFSRENVLAAYGIEAKVCYLGVDTELFRRLGLKRERFIVGLGSFDPIKGIDLAVKAVSLLSEPRPSLVWIANSTNESYEKDIRELAQSLGVDLRIHCGIADTELVNILNRATLLLFTSRLEPFGLAPLEANACGLPVVGIAEGGIRETVENGLNGFLVDPEPGNIASAMNRLLDDPALVERLAEQGTLHVQKNWNVEASVDRLENLLHEVVG
jgi:glycosyltransferase involved in cell wall biosynthesis